MLEPPHRLRRPQARRSRWSRRLAFAVFGVVTFTKLKIEAFPDVTNVQVMVITPLSRARRPRRWRSRSPSRSSARSPARRSVLVQRSITSFGLSQVILTFEDGVDIYFARQQVAERLPDAEVPDGVEPHLGPNDTPVGQVYQYTLESDHHTPSELRSWQDWVVSKHLMRAPGVADVVSFGGFQKEYHVLADPAQLRNNGLTLQRPDRRGRRLERRDVGRLPAARRVASSSCAGAATCSTPQRHREHRRRARRTARRCWCATSPRSSRRTRRAGAPSRAAPPSTRSRGRSCSAAARTPRTSSTACTRRSIASTRTSCRRA